MAQWQRRNLISADRILQCRCAAFRLSGGDEPLKIMNTYSFKESRTNGLLSRVGEDVSMLRQDLGNLVSHTARHALPAVADLAKDRLASGGVYTMEHLRSFGVQMSKRATARIGGAMLIGCLAAGAYLLFNSRHETLRPGR